MYGSVAFWRDKDETWDEIRGSSNSRQRTALLTSALVALLVQTPEVDRNRRYDGRANEQRDIDGASYAPDKLFADGAEGRLGEERSAEFVGFHQVDFGLFDCPSTLVKREDAVPLLLGL